MQRSYRYWGFISYSHQDRKAAERLHALLESYRIPARLVGLDGPFGPAPERLQPIFRDRDDLHAGGELRATVRHALGVSRSLIVLCSPAAAASSWVDAEVAEFTTLHPDSPLFCVFVPHTAGASVSRPLEDCLPPALKPRFAAAHGMSETAPIAVDLAADEDGWKRGVLKIAAGLTGMPLDQLVQRDAQRRQRRLAWLAAALAVVALTFGLLAASAYRARNEARFQRAQAEGLIEFMLVDLRKKLEPHGRLDALESVGEKALAYYNAQPANRLDIDSLGRRARALHLVGEIGDRRGDPKAARAAFSSARKATAELLTREPDNPERLYEHAQSVYWTGYMDWQYGDLKNAERSLEEYALLAERLSAKRLDDPDALAEVGYAHANLGTLLMEQGRASDAIVEFRESLRINRKRLVEHSGDLGVQLDLGQDRSWLSTALFAARQLKPAIAEREAQLELYTQLLPRARNDATLLEARMFAHHKMAELTIAMADQARARAELRHSIEAANALRMLDEKSTLWKQGMAASRTSLARLARFEGDLRAAQDELRRAAEIIDGQLRTDPENLAWRLTLQEDASLERVAILLALDDVGAAEAELVRSGQRLQEFSPDGSAGFRSLRFRIHNAALRAELERRRGSDEAIRSSLKEVIAMADGKSDRLDPLSACRVTAAGNILRRDEDMQALSACELGSRSSFPRTRQPNMAGAIL